MELEIQKLQTDIISLMEHSRKIQNSNEIPECLRNIQIRLIFRLIDRARAKIDYLEDRQKCIQKTQALK